MVWPEVLFPFYGVLLWQDPNLCKMRLIILFFLSLGVFNLQAQEVTITNLEAEIADELSVSSNTYEPSNQVESTDSFVENKLARKLLKAADKAFDNMWYSEASQHYNQAFAYTKNIPAMQTLQKAADSYYFIGDMENASKWYNVLFDNYEDVLSEDDLFKYSDVLKGVGRKQNADRILDLIAEKDFEKVTTTPSFLKHKEQVLLKSLKINTKYSEFGSSFRADGKVVFASAADTGVFKTRKYKWNNQPFLDLYEANVQGNGYDLGGIKKLSKDVNTKQHEASAAFSPDGTTMYFTRNNDQRKKRKNKKNVNHLKIFSSKLIDGKWDAPKEVAFNNENYSTGHPALSPDGKQMYFVSDMPGGYGYTDLYVVDIDESGEFSEPRNLGPEINSSRKEMFPFVTENKLYFSSDRKSGLGGLDIYESTISQGLLENPINIGKPYNSIRDDFAFTIKEEEHTGYLASNRKGGKGDDDIYYFKREKPENSIENKNRVNGVVIDAITEAPVANANVVLFDSNNLKIAEIETEEDGTFKLENLISNYDYTLNVKKDDYEELMESLTTKDNIQIQLTQKLIPVDAVDIVQNAKKETMFKTEAVYFNFDSFSIRNDAKEELDRLADYLVQNESMKLKIESHTDSRGNAAYNKYLSDKRAKASKEYLLSKGVSQDQIVSAIGYGEEQLLNDCSDGVSCSRRAHQLNRRSEFIFVNE
jgi:outer membrane protein OmpA-like peptidoglycan-associated protein